MKALTALIGKISPPRTRSIRNDALKPVPTPPRSAVLFLAVIVLPILTGCGLLAARSDSRYTVEMTDENRFLPGTVDIPRGGTVVWINRGRFEHTTTADPALALVAGHAVLPSAAEPWHSGNVSAGQMWERTFNVPGTYVYFCQWHEADGMLGSIRVTEEDAEAVAFLASS